MNRTEFITATALVLFAAFALGWFAGWLVHRFARVTQADVGELDRMAQALHDAEETRDQALAYLDEREREAQGEMTQIRAELGAAMDGLRDARTEAAELRAWIERHGGG
jgi:prophage endopeptidase